MALLKLAENNKDVDYLEHRDILFYNTFKYRLRLYAKHIYFILSCSSVEELEFKVKNSWNYFGRMSKVDVDEVVKNFSFLKKVLNFILSCKDNNSIRIRTESSTISIFSNDLNTLKHFVLSLEDKCVTDVTEAVTGCEKQTKYFTKEPKYKFRVYLREKIVDSEFRKSFSDTLKNLTTVCPSKSLVEWLEPKNKQKFHRVKYCCSHFYIDYNDESMLSYITIVHGEMLGKKYKLVKRQEKI